jgi:hypothetical protein
MNNNIKPMPTQNPKPMAWVGLGMGMSMGTQCRALEHTQQQCTGRLADEPVEFEKQPVPIKDFGRVNIPHI